MILRNPDGSLTDHEKKIVRSLLEEGWRNQDIQALINIGRKATINGARITEVKQNEKIAHASEQELEFFKTKQHSYDLKTGLNVFEDERLIRSREAMILAVQAFNSPALSFKTEVFCVLANIAWTYLLHQHYIDQGVQIQGKDGRTLLLSQMLEREDSPLAKGVTNNLKTLKNLRDSVEHLLLGKADQKWMNLFQACCLNFDKTVCQLYGDNLSLQKELAFALQFAKLTLEQASTLQKYEIPEQIEALDGRLKEKMSEEELDDHEYQFQVVYTLSSASKSKSNVQFINPESDEAGEIRQVLLKYKTSDDLYPFKPSKVTKLVAGSSKKNFTSFLHTQAWKKYKARPKNGSSQPNNTNKDFCIYHAAHGDYTYSKKWVDFLVDKIADEKELNSLREWR